MLDFEEPRILKAYEDFKRSGRGDRALLYDGSRVRHYGLTDQKEFFAEMTESYFGVDEALPVGNGRWARWCSGEPTASASNSTSRLSGPAVPTIRHSPADPRRVPAIRRLVFAGKYFQAEALFAKAVMGKPDQMKYQPLCNLFLEIPGHTNVSDYRRRLDLDTAIASLSYRIGDATFQREVFASPEDQVIVVRLTSDKPGAISFRTKLAGILNTNPPGDEKFTTEVQKDGQLVLRGTSATSCGIKDRVNYVGRVRVLNEGGTLATTEDAVSVEGANSVMLLIVAATNFKRYDDISGDPENLAKEYMAWVENRTYDRLLTRHVEAHQRRETGSGTYLAVADEEWESASVTP